MRGHLLSAGLRTAWLLAAGLLVAGCASAPPASPDHARLAELFAQDQADRRLDDEAPGVGVDRRDAERRREVDALVARGALRTAADHYHAAMVLQHGSDSTAYRRAHTLAATAARMGHVPARWLAAAALDRYLLSTGRPQHYATQFVEHDDGTWYLNHLDSTAVTDDERHRVGARTLAETRAFLAATNGTPTGSLAPPPEPEPRGETVELIGSLEALARQIVYPEAALAAGVAGSIRIQLTVRPDGTVGDAFVVDGLGHGLDEEALRVVRTARFVNSVGEAWEIRLAVPVAP